jgi:hypothetical protein
MAKKTARRTGKKTTGRKKIRRLSLAEAQRVLTRDGHDAARIAAPASRLMELAFFSQAASAECIHQGYFRATPGRGRSQDWLEVVREIPRTVHPVLKAAHRRRSKNAVSEAVLRPLARSVSTALHLGFQDAYARPRRGKRTRSENELLRALSAEELNYRTLLLRTRGAVSRGDAVRLVSIYGEVISRCDTELIALIRDRTDSKSAGMADMSAGLRISRLCRQHALLAAAILILLARLSNTRRRKFLVETAGRRMPLARGFLDPRRARRTTFLKRAGDTEVLIGRVRDVAFQDRPRKAFSVATLDGVEAVLMVPYKSLPGVGVATGAAVVAQGSVRSHVSRGRYLEVQFEGPGRFKRSHWEDFLVDAARDTYNLYPNALHMEWEFASTLGTAAASDLFSRVG